MLADNNQTLTDKMIAHLKSPYIQDFVSSIPAEWQEKAVKFLAIIGIEAVRKSNKRPTIENLKQMADDITGKNSSEEEISKELRKIRLGIETLNEKFQRKKIDSPSTMAKNTVKRARFEEVPPTNSTKRSVSAPTSQPIEAPKPPTQWRGGDKSIYQRRYYSPQAASIDKRSGRNEIDETIYPEWWAWSKSRSERVTKSRPVTGKVTEHNPTIVPPSRVKVKHHLDATLMKDALRDPQNNISERKPPLPLSSERLNRTAPLNKTGLSIENEQPKPANTSQSDALKKPLLIQPQQQATAATQGVGKLKSKGIGRIASQKWRSGKTSQQEKENAQKVVPQYLRNVESKIKDYINYHKLLKKGSTSGPNEERGESYGDNKPFGFDYGNSEDIDQSPEYFDQRGRDYSTVKYKSKERRTPYREQFTRTEQEFGSFSDPRSREEAYGNLQTGHFRTHNYCGNEHEGEGQQRNSLNPERYPNQNLLEIANSFLRSPLMQKFSSPESLNKIMPSNHSRKDSSSLLVNVTAFDPKISLAGRQPFHPLHRHQQSTNTHHNQLHMDSMPSHQTYQMSKPSRMGDDNYLNEIRSSASSSNFSVLALNDEMKDFYQKEFFEQQNVRPHGRSKVSYPSGSGESYFASMGGGASPDQHKYSEDSSNLSEEKYQLNPRKVTNHQNRESISFYNIFKRDGIDVSHLLSE